MNTNRFPCHVAGFLLPGLFVLPLAAQFQLRQEQTATIGGSMQFQVQGATPGGLVVLGLSFGLQDPPLSTPLGAVYLAPPFSISSLGIANSAGTAQVGFPIPNVPAFVGARLWAQALDLTSLSLSSPTVAWVGPPGVLDSPNAQSQGAFGWSVATGDFLGGSDLDIAIGAPGESVGGMVGSGRVYVFQGPDFVNVVALAPMPQVGGQFGRALVALDFDGDGNRDLAVGAPGYDSVLGPDTGRVHVFSHPVGTGAPIVLTAPLPLLYEGLGESLAAGDLDNDGREELLAGAPHPGGGGSTIRRVVVFANTGSLITTSVLADPSLSTSASFGDRIAVGDFTGDGLPDVAVSDPAFTGAYYGQGVVHVFPGSGAPTIAIGNPTPAFGDRFGAALAAGDVTGDGVKDLLIGATGKNCTLLFAGPALANSASLPTVRPGDIHGGRAAVLADLDGNGHLDVVMSSTACTVPTSPCGSLSTWFGPSLQGRGFLTHANLPQVLTPGWALAAGDLDGNGRAEIVAGAPYSDSGGMVGTGRVLLFR